MVGERSKSKVQGSFLCRPADVTNQAWLTRYYVYDLAGPERFMCDSPLCLEVETGDGSL
jgi:hypothetical protein